MAVLFSHRSYKVTLAWDKSTCHTPKGNLAKYRAPGGKCWSHKYPRYCLYNRPQKRVLFCKARLSHAWLNLPDIMIQMVCHIFSIHISVQMNIPFRGSPASVPKKSLGDIHASALIHLCGRSMTKQMAVQMLV